jgi:hypothetical protein
MEKFVEWVNNKEEQLHLVELASEFINVLPPFIHLLMEMVEQHSTFAFEFSINENRLFANLC